MVSKNIAIIFLILGVLLIAGCSDAEKTQTDNMQLSLSSSEQVEKEAYTEEMVAEHDTSGDCWVIVEEDVYDVSSLITNHQAKETLEACGRTMDMLLIKEKLDFDTLQEARGRLQDYYLGELS